MAASKVLYLNNLAQEFRTIIRPVMFGRIHQIEPIIAMRAAAELTDWMVDLVNETMRVSELRDMKGAVKAQLTGGIRVYGRSSLRNLRGQIMAQPWIFAHEYGAHITPTDGKRWLAIPFADALRADGSVKFKNPSSWKRYGSFVLRDRKSDRLFLVYKGADGVLHYLYVLVESVDIPKRLRLNQTANQMLPTLLGAFGHIFVQEMATRGVRWTLTGE